MKNNPFVLPGFGQAGAMGENPILASMEMMRQAWEGLASSGSMDAEAMGRLMSVEEMDKRISDLRAVENWLRMNLSMLSSTIQGLEVQRATVATLKTFVETGLGGAAAPSAGGASQERPRGHSPLEEALKAWPGPTAAESRSGAAGAAASSASDANRPSGEQAADKQADRPSGEPADVLASAASAAQGWWNLMQQQFQTLAAATAASAEGAMADFQQAAGQAAEQGAAAFRSSARKTTAAKSAAKTATAKKNGKTGAASKTTKATKVTKATKATKAAKTTQATRKAGSTGAARKTGTSTSARKTGR